MLCRAPVDTSPVTEEITVFNMLNYYIVSSLLKSHQNINNFVKFAVSCDVYL